MKKELSNLKLIHRCDLKIHLAKFGKITEKLKDVGSKFDERDLLIQLLISLLDEYNTIVEIIENLNFETTKEKLLNFYVN